MPFLRDAVVAGGGQVVAPARAQALVWSDPREVDLLRTTLEQAPQISWVQLPWAGVEPFAEAGVFGDGRTWTCGKGVYAEEVAEHALALGLMGLRKVDEFARADSWSAPRGRSLFDGNVTILGAGGITVDLVRLLVPFRAEVTVVRRSGDDFPGAARTLPPDRLHDALRGADLVVLALALTPQTTGVIDAAALAAMESHAWLVNVARGAHVVTHDLVAALEAGALGGSALDVTDPEPLPDGHPLWHLPNCVITPHTANTPEMSVAPLSRRIAENVRRFAAGEPLLGLVDPALGY
jgi:phosphoglycerate dehydrogenase-like enzyme